MDKKFSSVVNRHLEDDTGLLMLQISNLWKDHHSKVLKKYFGLTQIQYAVLIDLYWFKTRNKNPVTQTMLAKHIRIDMMTLSYIFKGLEARGLVSRITHPVDVRAKAVDLTEEGKELMDQAMSIVEEVDRKFFEVLGKDAGRFNKYLRKLLSPKN